MKLTRRGRVAVAVVALSMVLGLLFGARSLNAIAAPTLAALLGSAVLVYRGDPPTASLSSVDAGFPGETRSLTLELSGTGLVAVSLPFPAGVDGEASQRRVTLPQTLSYDLELTGRGVHEIGPPDVALRGPLGLFERETPIDGTAEVTVYPSKYSAEGGSILARLFVDELEAERQEFDRLREYRPGDPLRHIHWKSSAKHDEFLVTEFAPSERDETVTILGTAPKGEVDEMARLAATIADLAFDGGYKVEVATPTGHVPPGQGDAHRQNILQLLAQTTRGTIAPLGSEEADIEIAYAQRELVVRIGAEEFTVPQLLEHVDAPVDEEMAGTSTADAEVTP
jgi:uncharacterized protein (DUF58 family)